MRSDPADNRSFIVFFNRTKFIRINYRWNNNRFCSFFFDVIGDKPVAADNRVGAGYQIIGLAEKFEKTSEFAVGRADIADISRII